MTAEAIHYCKGWFLFKKKPVEPLTTDEARVLHEAGAEYVALIGDPVRPRAYVQFILSRNFACSTFLDEYLRPMLYCIFTGSTGQPLFLSQSMTRKFKDDTDQVIFAWNFKLSPDGKVVAVEANVAEGTERVGEGQFNTTSFYVERPSFGQYDAFLKFGKDGKFDPTLT